ncbi:MAG: enoyl-CoA hydratase/isomerase family protein [Acidimicrobiales bacterium]
MSGQSESGNGVLRVDTDGALRILGLNRPDKGNALSAALRADLVAALDNAAGDDDIGAVLLTAAGETFCAGFDLAELSQAPDPAKVFAEARHYHHTLHTFPKPLVAAIGGPALAGGFDLALLCDVRIASPAARFGQPQVRRGIPASYELMAHIAGVPAARELCLSGRIVEADEARQLGLVTELVEADDLAGRAAGTAHAIADNPAGRAAKAQFVAHQPPLFAPKPG